MKEHWVKPLLCLLVLMMCTIPASAYQVHSWGEIGPDSATSDWYYSRREALDARKIYEHKHASFSEGLLRIFQGGEGTPDNFIDQNGNLVDLNRGRYSFMSTFQSGLSSVESTDFSGYVNRSGDVVLDTSKYGSFHYYEVMTSRFVGGKALISNSGIIDLRHVESRTLDTRLWENAEFVVIDTKGKVLETIKGVEKLIAHPLFKTSITDYDGVPLGVLMDPMAYVGTGGGSTTEPAQPAPEPTKEYLRPDLPDYTDAETYFQSKGKITNIVLGDLDFGAFILTVTNDTNKRDSGVIAVAAANVDGSTSNENSSGVFFVSYVLEPNSSAKFQILHRDILHLKMFPDDNRYTGAKAGDLTGLVDAKVIHFVDDDDLWAFYEAIPYEQNWQPQNVVSEFRPVCSGAEGKAFLEQLRIHRAAVQSGDHTFCQP